jgi:uncharacterized BrkB/YihY/UPF0761 family membrane protein
MAEGTFVVEPRARGREDAMARVQRRRTLPAWRIAVGVLRRAVLSFVEDGCSQHAAAISYFALFSFSSLIHVLLTS